MLGPFRRAPLRVALVAVLALTIQTTFCATHRPLGVTPDLMLALAIASAIAGGAELGVIAGFVFGLSFDLTLTTPLGLSALTFAVCAFIVAVAKDSITLEQAWWLTLIFSFVGSAGAVWFYAVAGELVGKRGWISSGLIKQSIVVGVINTILGLPLTKMQGWTMCVRREAPLKPLIEQ